MTEIKSLSAPALGEADLRRLLAAVQPRRFTATSTLFDTGYEQAKRDFREIIHGALRIPNDDIDHTQHIVQQGKPTKAGRWFK